MIGVSRTPVREALLLVSEGLIELVPQRGAFVPVLTGREISELMDLRAALERHAATRTVTRGAVPTAAMTRVLREQESLLADGQRPELAKQFIQLDRDFHSLLIDAVGSQLLSSTYSNLRVRQVRIGVQALYLAAGRQQTVCGEHQRILDSLTSEDLADAHRAIDEHIEATLKILLAS